MSDFNVQTADRAALDEKVKELGLSVAHNIGDDTLRSKIAETLGVVLESTPTPTPEPTTPADRKEERVTILVHESENDKRPVQVALNGKQFVIKRGAEVDVPAGVVEILNNSVEQKRDEEGNWSSHPSYPFRVIGEAG